MDWRPRARTIAPTIRMKDRSGSWGHALAFGTPMSVSSRGPSDLVTRIRAGGPGIAGVMLESFLVAGRQALQLGRSAELTYGQSVTDACIGWDDTVVALRWLASAVSARRLSSSALSLEVAP
jgi:DAHP synthetase I family